MHLTDVANNAIAASANSRIPRALGVQLESHRPVSELVGKVMRQLSNAPTSSICPTELKSLASKLSFNDGRQHDASEFLRSIINGLLEDPAHSDLFKTIFGFETCGVVRCDQCGHESVTKEPSIDLSLEIATAKTGFQNGDSTTLESLISAFFTPTRLEGSDKYQCDKCQDLTNATRSTHLASLPKALVLTLNRFRYSSSTMRKAKVMQKVIMPELLSIASEEYRLSAVVVHSGPTADGGHYYSYSRLPTATGYSQWYRFDDRSVSEMSFDHVRDACRAMPMDSAYMLIYTRA